MKSANYLLILFVFAVFIACKEKRKDETRETEETVLSSDREEDTLTNKEKTNVTQSGPAGESSSIRNNKGIGPIDRVDLPNDIDDEMVEAGKIIFNQECASCHRIHESKMGPALGNVLERRSPEFVMNLILNTNEMLDKDPIMKSLRGEYEEEMIQTDVDEDEAREIIEYLRTYN